MMASELWPRDQHTWSDTLNYVTYETKHEVKSGLHHLLLFFPSSSVICSLLSIKWSNHGISWKTRFNKTFYFQSTKSKLGWKNMLFRNHHDYNITILRLPKLHWWLGEPFTYHFSTCYSIIISNVILILFLLLFSVLGVIWIANQVKWHFFPWGKKQY